MLLRATITNFRCFKDETSLSLVATSDESHPAHLISGASKAAPRVLRGAALYGANGHGKTKFVDAMAALKEIVVDGTDEGEEYVNMSFSLDAEKDDIPTTFVVEFNFKGNDYEYGIALYEEYISEEWLYSRPNVKEVVLFERKTSKIEGRFSTEIKPGRTLLDAMKSQNDLPAAQLFAFIAAGTRPEQPFLKEAVDRNIEALKPAYDWFEDGLVIVGADAEFSSLHTRAHAEPEFLSRISEFVRRADTGIERMETIEEPFEPGSFPTMPSSVRKDISEKLSKGDLMIKGPNGESMVIRTKDNGEVVSLRMVAIHRGPDNKEYQFPLSEESSGTQRLLHLVPMIFALAESDTTFIVDEVDRKLHPLLAYEFIDSFLREKGAGQIVFTTHNTHLLNLALLRRDEIWFVQKTHENSSYIYSLSDMKVRGDLNIENGYLNGRFGAIPFIGSTKELGWHH